MQASTSRATAEVQQQFKELTLSPAQREGKEPVFEGRVTGAWRLRISPPACCWLCAASLRVAYQQMKWKVALQGHLHATPLGNWRAGSAPPAGGAGRLVAVAAKPAAYRMPAC